MLRLEDREMIRQQKARYCRAPDTKQFDAWERIFKPDATIVAHDVGGSVVAEFGSAADFSRLTRELFSTNRTIHRAHHSEIAFPSETEASAIGSMEDGHVETSAGEGSPKTMHGYGFHHEVRHPVGEEWKLAGMELHRNIVFERPDRRGLCRGSRGPTCRERSGVMAMPHVGSVGPAS